MKMTPISVVAVNKYCFCQYLKKKLLTQAIVPRMRKILRHYNLSKFHMEKDTHYKLSKFHFKNIF